ncbi:hypothetical protein CTI14_01380 [Methylobacterium radiotolerans]|nr:hypothetical protein CTI14_01380 [Methylobacterium radiotolerans]
MLDSRRERKAPYLPGPRWRCRATSTPARRKSDRGVVVLIITWLAGLVGELLVLLVSEFFVLRALRLEREFRLSTHDYSFSSVMPDSSERE